MKTSLGAIVLSATFLVVSCSDEPQIAKSQAIESVLEVRELESVPSDLTADLEEDVPKRLGDVGRVWVVRSGREDFIGWVDAETGEVLDVIFGVTSSGPL